MGHKGTNLRLSNDELAILRDTSFFESKRKITENIIDIFRSLEISYKDTISSYPGKIPEAAMSRSGKISRGENYLGLPYLVLDFPAHFDKKGIFTFRTMMWWGHPFSITFHISGFYLELLPDDFLEKLSNGNAQSILVCIHENQWQHHHQTDNYIPLSAFLLLPDHERKMKTKNFIKIALLIPIENINELHKKCNLFLQTILENYEPII